MGFDVCEEEEREGEELVVTIGLFALWLAIWGLLVVPWGSVGQRSWWIGRFEGEAGVSGDLGI